MPTTQPGNPATTQATPPSWYVVNQAENSDEAEIKIYDYIGMFGVTARQFTDQLEGISAKRINLRLNTGGGEIFDGFAIYNALDAHPAEIVVHIDGLAASAASVVAMAGDEVRMADNAFLMIHEAQVGVMGEADDLRQQADLLDKINDNIAMTYQKRAGQTRQYWRNKMGDETWFTAAEAKAEGLADAIDKSAQPENRFDLKIFNKAPKAAKAMWAKTKEATMPTAELPTPNEGESKDDFMTRCMAADGGSEESCQMQWDNAQPANNKAPEEPQRSDSTPAPVAQQKDTPMSTITTPAQTPAGDAEKFSQQAIQNYIENGRKIGFEEGEANALARMGKLIEAAPGRPQLVIDAFVNRQSPEALSLAFKAAETAAASQAKINQDLKTENARLQALISAGGHSGVSVTPASNGNDSLPQSYEIDPESRAKTEWDSQPGLRASFGNNEKKFMAYRVNQLKGNVRVLSKSA